MTLLVFCTLNKATCQLHSRRHHNGTYTYQKEVAEGPLITMVAARRHGENASAVKRQSWTHRTQRQEGVRGR